jgi:hypothetical protein
MKKILLITLLSIFTLTGCQEDVPVTIPIDGTLVGCWIKPQYLDEINGHTVISYQKDKALDAEYGFQFLDNGTLIERANAGFCGTPPVSYDNFDGTYQLVDKQTITIDVAFWGGRNKQTWHIIALTNTTLTIEIVQREVLYNEGWAQTNNTAKF